MYYVVGWRKRLRLHLWLGPPHLSVDRDEGKEVSRVNTLARVALFVSKASLWWGKEHAEPGSQEVFLGDGPRSDDHDGDCEMT